MEEFKLSLSELGSKEEWDKIYIKDNDCSEIEFSISDTSADIKREYYYKRGIFKDPSEFDDDEGEEENKDEDEFDDIFTVDDDEVWLGFDEIIRLTKWIRGTNLIGKRAPILDIGCEDSVFLTQMASHGYSNLSGIHSSADSSNRLNYSISKETFRCTIYMNRDMFLTKVTKDLGNFTVAIDRGTYDEWSVNEDIHVLDKYAQTVYKLLSMGGVFIIISYKFTFKDLHQQFGSYLEPIYVIPPPESYIATRFGCETTSVVFQKQFYLF